MRTVEATIDTAAKATSGSRMRVLFFGLIAVLLALGTPVTEAHGDWPPKHGGLRNNDGGEVAFELVLRGRDVVLYLEDHGEPMSAVGARGVLIVTRGESVLSSEMKSGGGNRLVGRVSRPLARGDRLVAKLTFRDGSIAEGHFYLK